MSRYVRSVREKAAFRALRDPVAKLRKGPLSVAYNPDEGLPRPKVAYAVGRRCGGAVERNRVRRRLRAAVDEVALEMVPGTYLFSAGPGVVGMPFGELNESVLQMVLEIKGRWA